MFKHHPAADETVDPEWEFVGTPFAIQDCRSYGGGFTVIEYGPSRENIEWVQTIKTCKTLACAKLAAIAAWETRT